MATYYKNKFLMEERAYEILKAVGKAGITENDLVLALRSYMVSERAILKFLERLIEAGKAEKKNNLFYHLKTKHDNHTPKLTKQEQELLKITEN